MTSLEFIEKEIAMVKKKISMVKSKFTIKGLTYYHINEIKEEINILRDRLQVLQQIKSELEAWEVVKHTIYKRKMGEESFIQVMGGVYNEEQCWTSGINPYEIIKKALEVEDD